MSLRDEIASLLPGAETALDERLAVDVLEQAGVRADQTVPPLLQASLPTIPPVSIAVEGSGELALRRGDVENRYRFGDRLGEGGMGVVHLASDRNLGRQVAVKTIHPERCDRSVLGRFVAEARITAQLEHPGIVPVHDLFISEDGDVFYTMKRVQGQSLGDVLDALRTGDPAAVVRHHVNHLLGLFRSAAQAVAYAHTRRVVHRDLKPDNIMVGDFGEVLVMDWGVARMLDDAPEELRKVVLDGASVLQTVDGAIVGSPAYMAPECIGGDPKALGPGADVYSLGVLLYELLTLQRPHQATTVPRLLYLVATEPVVPPSRRAPGREVPSEIEAICMRALSRNPVDRYGDAGELVRDLEGYLEGVGPRREADRLVADGRELMLLFARRASDAEDAETRVRALQSELQSWDPIDMKRLVWKAKREHADTVAHADTVFGDCEAAFESALSHVPGYRPAQEGLADLYWIRFLQAEEAREPRWVRRWAELIQRYAPERYARRLRGDGTLSLITDPPGASACLRRLVEQDGLRVPGEATPLGATPVQGHALPMGPFIVEVRAEGRAPASLPVVVDRLQNVEARVSLVCDGELQPGFLHIPGGPVVLGGDPAAISGLPEGTVDVADFAIARYPVTVAEYFVYLAELTALDPGQARQRSPRVRGNRGVRQAPLIVMDPGRYALPFTDADGTVWHPEQPIVSIGLVDARAFAAWRSERDGVPYRLPLEAEWEKAARGLDHRLFPWGDVFDASFCVMSESSPDVPDLPAVGAVPTDCSPYGVRDLAGGVRDWCEWDEGLPPPPGRHPVRGGSYGTVEIYCRCASRSVVGEDYVGSHLGFRLVQVLR